MKPNLANTLNTAFDEAKASLHKALLQGLASLFEAHPNVKSVQFQAYTPYFNDGEECTYRCNADSCTFNGYEEYADSEIEADGEDINANAQKTQYSNGRDVTNPNYNKEAKMAVDEFQKELGSIKDEIWKMVVGDHVSVNITPESITITTVEYDHE